MGKTANLFLKYVGIAITKDEQPRRPMLNTAISSIIIPGTDIPPKFSNSDIKKLNALVTKLEKPQP